MVDGGISSNLPTAPAEATGAIVLAVRLHGYTEKENRNSFDTTLEFADRVTSILMASVEEKSLRSADVIIEPKVDQFDLGAFKREEMLEAIAAGETAANAAMPEIRRVLNGKVSANPRLEHQD
jgi:predicted acylesterase/phospholipase RssA